MTVGMYVYCTSRKPLSSHGFPSARLDSRVGGGNRPVVTSAPQVPTCGYHGTLVSAI